MRSECLNGVNGPAPISGSRVRYRGESQPRVNKNARAMLWILALMAVAIVVALVVRQRAVQTGWTPVKQAARAERAKQERECQLARRAARNAHERVQAMMRADTLRMSDVHLTRNELRLLDQDLGKLMELRANLDRQSCSALAVSVLANMAIQSAPVCSLRYSSSNALWPSQTPLRDEPLVRSDLDVLEARLRADPPWSRGCSGVCSTASAPCWRCSGAGPAAVLTAL